MRRRDPKSVTEINPLTLEHEFYERCIKKLSFILHETLTSVSIQAIQGQIQSVACTADKRRIYIYRFF